MNPLPNFNGPGMSLSQPVFPPNNIIQGVPIYNTQIPQYQPTKTFIQPIAPEGNSHIPQPQHVINPPLQHPSNNQHLYRMSSTSDEELLGFEENDSTTQENPWQLIKSRNTKRRKINVNSQPQLVTNNKFNPLSESSQETSQTVIEENKTPRPPPIFVYGVINYNDMINNLRTIAEDKQYITKCLADNTIKIICDAPETYRKMIKFMRDKNVVHHTYQPKEERAYRIVIKHLHHTTDTKEISQELANKGHKVRNIMNGRSRTSKEPLNIFFVDLEPANNNKDIYKLTNLQNRAIQIEPPKKTKGITQCMRCQQYGHSRTYCNRPFVCVKCGGSHNTIDCKKNRDTPARCALCNGSHPANYKGCEFYHKLFKQNNANNRLNIQHNVNIPTNTPAKSTQVPNEHQQPRTYAQAVNNSREEHTSIHDIMNKFLDEFKSMFQQLIQQNSMVLNMLTALISKIQ